MKAMILAAGRGERMQQLSESIPKPLILLRGKPLIEHRLLSLKQAGFTDIVINLFYLGEQIAQYLGDGSRYGVTIQYSWEKTKLDVGGGIKQALSLLGHQPFLLTSADIDTNYPYANLHQSRRSFKSLAHLVLTDNPNHHPQGDFFLDQSTIKLTGEPRLSYMSVAVFDPALFSGINETQFSFMDCLRPAISAGKVSGEYFGGRWINVDTPERLALANAEFL